jgi:thioredoxin reductase (NADPH)
VDLQLDENDRLKYIILDNGKMIERETIYQKFESRQQPIVEKLGLKLDEDGHVQVSQSHQETSTPGIYAAGDMASHFHQFAIAVGMGCNAASSIALDLMLQLEEEIRSS